MRRKDNTIETLFHPTLMYFLFWTDDLYREWEDETVITCGSEATARHNRKSLHYVGHATDIRSWSRVHHGRGIVPVPTVQLIQLEYVRENFCIHMHIPSDWIDIVLEGNHFHIEYQPKIQEDRIIFN